MESWGLLEEFDWFTGSIVLGIFFVLISMAAILFVRRFLSRETLKRHHDVTGFVFTNLGVLFSVLLGFTVVNVQQRFDRVKEMSQEEANLLAGLYHGAVMYSPEETALIRKNIRAYTENVIRDEWMLMASKQLSATTLKSLSDIWDAYYNIKLTTKKQEIWYAEAIRKLNSLEEARLSRIIGSEQSLGSEMWTFLILGALTLVVFIAFFALDNLKVHILLGSILAFSTAFLLFLIYSLDTAFKGVVQIPPDAMERILKTLV